jgi:hypothetical protein
MEKRRVYDVNGNVNIDVIVDKTIKALEANGFEKHNIKNAFYRRRPTQKTPSIHVKEWHDINARDEYTTITTHMHFTKAVCEYAGYILIKISFSNIDNAILNAVCVMDCDDISVLNTTFADIRKRLMATGYFGTHDFY